MIWDILDIEFMDTLTGRVYRKRMKIPECSMGEIMQKFSVDNQAISGKQVLKG